MAAPFSQHQSYPFFLSPPRKIVHFFFFFLSTQWKVGQDAIENKIEKTERERVIKERALCYETKGRVKFLYGDFYGIKQEIFCYFFLILKAVNTDGLLFETLAISSKGQILHK